MAQEQDKQVSTRSRGLRPGCEGALVETELFEFEGTSAVAAVLWLNRPDALNAMTIEMIEALDGALKDADADPQVCAVLISGRGRAFSAGGDLKAYIEKQRDPVGWGQFMDTFGRVFGSIPYLTKPVVALVNGITLAGGLELLVACDFAYGSRSARIGDGHLRYGQMGGAGVLARLPRIVGPFRARELLFSARILEAEEAWEWGLLSRVVDDDALLSIGLEFAAGIAERSPAGVANMKYAINAGFDDGTGVHAALRLERERATLYLLTLPDSMEGLLAFSEKRKPKYPGR